MAGDGGGLPDEVRRYVLEGDRRRAREGVEMLRRLDREGQQLLKDAAVMGFVLGSQQAGGLAREDFPLDGQILSAVLSAARLHPDLYPGIAALAEGPAGGE